MSYGYGQGVQLGDLAGIARRRAGPAVAVAGAVFLASIFVAAILPNTYTAWTTLLVEPQTISKRLVEAGLEESDLANRLHLMTMQILSRRRLSRIIDEFSLYPEESRRKTREEVISLMRADIRVEPVLPELEVADTSARRRREIEINTFNLLYRSDSARMAAGVANRLANDFIQEHIKERVELSGNTSEFIDAQLAAISTQIGSVENRIAAVKNENIGRLPEDLSANRRLLERVTDALGDAQRDLMIAESDVAFYGQQALYAPASPYGQANTPERKLELLELQLAEYRSRGLTDKHPDIISTTQEIEALRTVVEERRAGGVSSLTGTQSFARRSAEAEQQRARLRAEAARREVQRLQIESVEIQERLADGPRVAEQLTALEREHAHLLASYQEFSAKQLEAGVAANMERRQKGEQFRILEPAFPPPKPSSPNRIVIVMVGLLLGLAAGAGAAFLLETADSSYHGVAQVQEDLELPVLAAIPKIVLESDRLDQRRRRLLAGFLAAGVSGLVLVGAGAGYVWVNGTPAVLESLLGEGQAAAPLEEPG